MKSLLSLQYDTIYDCVYAVHETLAVENMIKGWQQWTAVSTSAENYSVSTKSNRGFEKLWRANELC
jgi:hypothetical protein